MGVLDAKRTASLAASRPDYLRCRPVSSGKDVCDARSTKGDICLCKLFDPHPTQASVGMVEVRIKAEKLNDKIRGRSEKDFLKYLLRHDKEEPVIIGPGGIFYITDHHHLAERSTMSARLRLTARSSTTCQAPRWTIFGNAWKPTTKFTWRMENGDPLTPNDLPSSVKDLTDDPFLAAWLASFGVSAASRRATRVPAARTTWSFSGLTTFAHTGCRRALLRKI